MAKRRALAESAQPFIQAPSPVLPPLAPDRRPFTTAERLIVAASLALVWFLAWGHPLIPPDEGRYASVAAAMVSDGSWLVPEFRGEPHLTKPPLVYWLQAISITILGPHELAVRVPSLLATSATLALLAAFARRSIGTRPAVIAVAVAAVMPYTLIVGRLANTDALIGFFWLASLALGYRLMSEPDRRPRDIRIDRLLFWTAIALGLLTKREVAFVPLLVLAAWSLFAARPRDLLRLAPLSGLPLAAIPFALWSALVLAKHPEAASLWWNETVGRFTGEQDLRAEPWWFYLPFYLGGMFPASAMLVLPLFNCSFRRAGQAFLKGDLRALGLWAILLPLVGFSLSTGKLATYLLPLAPPTALLVAITLERWLRGTFDGAPIEGYRPPDVRRTVTIAAALIFLAQMIGAIAIREVVPELWALALPLILAPLGAVICWMFWRASPALRDRGLAIAWCGLAMSWTVAFAIQTRYGTPMGAPAMLASIDRIMAIESPQVVTVNFSDATIEFYNEGRETLWAGSLASLANRTDLRLPAVVLVDLDRSEDEFERALDKAPGLAQRLAPLGVWTRWFGKRTRILVLSEDPHSGMSLPVPTVMPPD
jgi:4-amino-4-deoxy-L-arabinose transferase-like glycosyltransferase